MTITKTKILQLVSTAFMALIMACGGNSPDTVANTTTSGIVAIGVDESFQPIIESQISTFQGTYKYAEINAAYKPEGAVVQDLLDGSIKVAVLSRQLTQEEVKQLEAKKIIPKTTKFANDAVTLIVNNNNPDSLLTMAQVRRIFNGETNNWSSLNPRSNLKNITIVFDNNNSSTARFVRDSLTSTNKLPANTFASNSHTALIDYVAQNENAIGVIGVNWISDLDDSTVVGFKKRIQVVGVSPEKNQDTAAPDNYFQPYQAYLAQKVYPLRRDLYVISIESRAGLGTGFASFVAGDRGQRIILKSGLVPSTMPVRIVTMQN